MPQQFGSVQTQSLGDQDASAGNTPVQESSRSLLRIIDDILESSLQLAKKLDITSVAEGVETRDDLDLLCRLNCDLAQGHFIAVPMD